MLIVPVVILTLRMTQLLWSAMMRSPVPSKAAPAGKLSAAAVAGPPSPTKSQVPPVPATVLIVPVTAPTLRMTQFPWSTTNRSPEPSRTTSAGKLSSPTVAAPPSPPKDAVPLPASVLILCDVAPTWRMRKLYASAMKRLPVESRATSMGELSWAAVAAPPSPAKPQAPPVPATVLILPVVATLRMTQLPLSAMKRLPAPSRATPVG